MTEYAKNEWCVVSTAIINRAHRKLFHLFATDNDVNIFRRCFLLFYLPTSFFCLSCCMFWLFGFHFFAFACFKWEITKKCNLMNIPPENLMWIQLSHGFFPLTQKPVFCNNRIVATKTGQKMHFSVVRQQFRCSWSVL